MDGGYSKNMLLEAMAAIETIPKINTTRIKSFFFIKKYNSAFKKEYKKRIKEFVASLKDILGNVTINVLYGTPPPDVQGRIEPLEEVLSKNWLFDTLLFYLFDTHKDAFLLKAGFSSAKTIPSIVTCDFEIINKLKNYKRTIIKIDFENDREILNEFHIFNSELFCPIFYNPVSSLDAEPLLVGFLTVGKNLYKEYSTYDMLTWKYISMAITVRLIKVTTYIELEATKLLKDHVECLGYDGYRFDEVIRTGETKIEDLEAYKDIKLNLKNVLQTLYGFKEAWKIFELFSKYENPT